MTLSSGATKGASSVDTGSSIKFLIPGSGAGGSISRRIPLYPLGFNGCDLFSQWGSMALLWALCQSVGKAGSFSRCTSLSESVAFLSVWGSSRNSWSPFSGSRSDLSHGKSGTLTPAVFAWPQVIASHTSLIGVMSLSSETSLLLWHDK